MLTVKYFHPDGTQNVFEAHEVVMAPSERASGSIGSVSFVRPKTPADSGTLVNVSVGTVYVMNDTGKTVATYDLSGMNALPARSSATFTASTMSSPF